ncbi:MAG: 3-dehydroquinate dehydratase [Gemmatimonadota bacterium]|nr:MAG: 3-dehydroquinate dehydratase [Gemmatimonadota bacterium]
MRVAVLHGPNLDLLGRRDPAQYGDVTLVEIDRRLSEGAERRGIDLIAFQSNHEGVLIDWIRATMDGVDGWLVNPAALGHTSYALRDALEAAGKPFVEVHLSNVLAREPFRGRSVLAEIAVGVVMGFRAESYLLALDGLLAHLASCGRADE